MRLAYPYPRYSRINRGGAKAFMQLEFTQEEQAFREEVRTFLRESLPREISGKVLNGFELSRDDYVEWQRRDGDTHLQRYAALTRTDGRAAHV